jgi:hypothetical protein
VGQRQSQSAPRSRGTTSHGDLIRRVVLFGDINTHVDAVRVHERQRLSGAPHAIGLGQQAHAWIEDVEDEPSSGRYVSAHRGEAAHEACRVVQMEQRVRCDEHEVERAAEVELAHVALHPFGRDAALARLALGLGQHLRSEVHADAGVPVGCDRYQLASGAAPQFQHRPALPIGPSPVEVDRGPSAGEHQVVQLRVRVEALTHEHRIPGMARIVSQGSDTSGARPDE